MSTDSTGGGWGGGVKVMCVLLNSLSLTSANINNAPPLKISEPTQIHWLPQSQKRTVDPDQPDVLEHSEQQGFGF